MTASNREAGQVVRPDGTALTKRGFCWRERKCSAAGWGRRGRKPSGRSRGAPGRSALLLPAQGLDEGPALELGKCDGFGQVIDISLSSSAVKWG